MPSLKLFGSIHADRRSKVRRELASFSEGADVLFVEYPEEGYDLRELASMFLRTPLFVLGVCLISVFSMPLYALCNRDRFPAEVVAARRIAAERDVPVVPVDEHFRGVVDALGVVWYAVEWVALLAMVALDPAGVVGTLSAVVLGYAAVSLAYRFSRLLWGVSALVAAAAVWLWTVWSPTGNSAFLLAVTVWFFVQLYRFHAHRNEHMLSRIAEECEANGYERACLTTGYAHVSGLKSNASSHGLGVAATYRPKWLREGKVTDGRTLSDEANGRVTVDPGKDVFSRRFVALLVDWAVLVPVLVVGSLLGLVVFVAGLVAMGVNVDSLSTWQEAAPLLVSAFLTDLAYWTLLEGRYGKTLGKRLLGLAVVDGEDTVPGVRTALVRNLLRPVDAFGFYLVGTAVSFLSERNGRLGDIAAGTRVVAVEMSDSS